MNPENPIEVFKAYEKACANQDMGDLLNAIDYDGDGARAKLKDALNLTEAERFQMALDIFLTAQYRYDLATLYKSSIEPELLENEYNQIAQELTWSVMLLQPEPRLHLLASLNAEEE